MSSEEIHFAQHLASNERRVRDKALARMRKWLRLRSKKEEAEFSKDGMMKLWKGLFYCMWMADKPLIQEELADNIGSLVHSFAKPSQSYLFIGAFFSTMARNHDHIDKFRIDKFLMLTRRFLRASLQYLKARDWEYKHVQKFISVLRESALSSKQEACKTGLGFRLHFFDIFVEEMARVGEGQIPQKRAHNILQPFYEVLTYCKSPMIVEAVRNKVFLDLIKLYAANLKQESDDEGLDEEDSAEISGYDFIDDEAEEYNGFLIDEEEEEDSEEGDITEQQIRRAEAKELGRSYMEDNESDRESATDDEQTAGGEGAAIDLLPIDFDISAVKASLLEFSRVEGVKRINRKAIEVIVKKIIDLENGVNPFAAPIEDSGSDIELTEDELKIAGKRLRVLAKGYANEAEKYLIKERDRLDDNNDEDFEMEGGEDDLAEFERTFIDDNAGRENRKPASKKGRKKVEKRRASGKGDHLSDSDDEHIGEIEKEIDEMNFQEARKPRKRNANGMSKPADKHNNSNVGHQKSHNKGKMNKLSNGAKSSAQKTVSKKVRT